MVCIKNDTSKDKPEIPLPKEVTVLSIDTPMAVLRFDNGTGGEEMSDSKIVKEIVTTEIPKDVITEYRDPNQPDQTKFRFRRPRPRPRTTTAKPVFISSTERFSSEKKDETDPSQQVEVNAETPDSTENNNDEDHESKEASVHVEQTLAKPETRFVKPLPPPRRETETAKPSTPTSLPFSSTTRKYPASLKTLRSFQQSNREREAAARQSTSTSVSYSTSTSTASSTSGDDDTFKVPLIRAKPSTAVTITPKPVIINSRPSQSIVRKASIDTKDYDDSKIPIISGVGPTRHGSNSNNDGGNLVTSHQPSNIVKAPPGSVQTQGVLVVQPPQNPSSHNPALSIARSPSLMFAEKSDIVLRDIQRNSDSITLRWESMKPMAGYRIIYRLFGEDAFRHGPPLAPTEREYKIKHIPFNVSYKLHSLNISLFLT